MGDLFGGAPSAPTAAAPQTILAPPPMPQPDPDAAKRAKRKAQGGAAQQKGRQATVLDVTGDATGETLGAS